MNDRSNFPLVSIGIPAYNRADSYLLKVIERSLGQTYANVEVIVSDNCSSDHTPELVSSIQDDRLRYIRQERNIGPANNFNFCANAARGDHFLLFHDDDMIDEDFIEVCLNALPVGRSVGTIHTGVRIIDEHDQVREEHLNNAAGCGPAEFIHGWFNGLTALYLCNTLYNTAQLKALGGFHSRKNLLNDLISTFTLSTRFGRVDVPDVKASFRRHSDNRGSKIPVRDWIVDSLQLLEVFCELLPEDCSSLRQAGKRYLCRKMYRHAARSPTRSQRLVDYLRAYRAFDYSLSPISHFYAGRIRHRFRF
jgi:glycosyltransferase involved in cell wall biosynthesis